MSGGVFILSIIPQGYIAVMENPHVVYYAHTMRELLNLISEFWFKTI